MSSNNPKTKTTYQKCTVCSNEMTGICSHEIRLICEKCGGNAVASKKGKRSKTKKMP